MMYRVLKVLNNNALVLDDEGNMLIGMGQGAGFGKKKGSLIDSKELQKTFESSNNQFMTKLSRSISQLDEKYYPLVDEIVSFISTNLGYDVNDHLYLTLAEHISFAKDRLDKNYAIPCPIEPEIMLLYPAEYRISQAVVEMMEKALNCSFPASEAGLIALHILNITMSAPSDDMVGKFQLIAAIIKQIEDHYDRKIDEESLEYTRLMTHLNFLCNRIYLNKNKKDGETQNIFFNDNCIEAINCSEKVKSFIRAEYNYDLNKNEFSYLVILIQNCMGGI